MGFGRTSQAAGEFLMTDDARTVPTRCTECEAHLDFPMVCTGCRQLYPVPESVDYFTLLGLDRRYDLDEEQLHGVCLGLARYIHPDRFAEAPEEVRRLATRLSAEVNNAVAVLLDPVRRASYLLDLAGGPTAGQERGVPGELLREVLVLREQITEAKERHDEAELERLRATIGSQREENLRRIAPLAEGACAADAGHRRELRLRLNAMKYWDNLLAESTPDPLAPATPKP